MRMSEWIFPINSEVYRIVDSLKELKIIDWKKTSYYKDVQNEDIVYIYSKSLSRIVYKGAVLRVNKPQSAIDASPFLVVSEGENSGEYIEIAVYRVFDICGTDIFTLKENGLRTYLQRPVKVNPEIGNYLHWCDVVQRESDKFKKVLPLTCLSPFPIRIVEEGVDKDISLSPLKVSKGGRNVTCRSCNREFNKAPRCPYCKQLMMYQSKTDFEIQKVDSSEGLLKYLKYVGFKGLYVKRFGFDETYIVSESNRFCFSWVKESNLIRLDCGYFTMYCIERYTELKHFKNGYGNSFPYRFVLYSFNELQKVVDSIK